MKRLPLACALARGFAFAASAPAIFAHEAPHSAHATAVSAAATAPKLHAALRSLWHGHLVATHDYALAVHAGNKANETKAADAVVANAKDIANAVAGFYGRDAGDGLLKLLAGHWGAQPGAEGLPPGPRVRRRWGAWQVWVLGQVWVPGQVLAPLPHHRPQANPAITTQSTKE